MTKEQILEWLDKNARGFTQKDFELFKKFYEEATKELEAQIEKVKHYLDYDIPHDLINEATTKIWRMLK